jgi:hypothetical protein
LCQGFWQKYIDLFSFDGIKLVTESNFKGNKIVCSLNNKNFDKIQSKIKLNKLNLIKITSNNKKAEINNLVKHLHQEKILAIVLYHNKIIYS